MGSTPLPPLILRRPLPAAIPMQNVPPGRLLQRNPDGPLPPLLAPRASENGRKQPPHARKDPCCPCLILLTCSEHNCPCAKARRPCQNCDSSHGCCVNTVAAHNAAIRETNREHLPSSTAARFCARMGLPPRQLIPLIVEPAECTGDDSESATTASPTTQRHIRRVQRQDGTQSTLSGASREGDDVTMSPNGGDTSPPPH